MSTEGKQTVKERLDSFISRTRMMFKSRKVQAQLSAESEKHIEEEETAPPNNEPPPILASATKQKSNAEIVIDVADDDWTICDSSADEGSTWRPSSPVFSDEESCDQSDWVCLSQQEQLGDGQT
jgi:hypothetical protein